VGVASATIGTTVVVLFDTTGWLHDPVRINSNRVKIGILFMLYLSCFFL
jgi:hypothetical protein